MPNKTLKEAICLDSRINQLTWLEEALLYRLLVTSDDMGRFDARPEIIKSRLFPLKKDISLKTIDQALRRISTVGLINIYTVDDRPTLQLTGSECYTGSNRNKTSRYPAPPSEVKKAEKNNLQSIAINCNQLQSKEKKEKSIPPAPLFKKEKKEILPLSKGVRVCEEDSASFTPPSIEEAKQFCRDKALSVNVELWYAHYQSTGWMVGVTPMADWRASLFAWGYRDGVYKPKAKSSSVSGITESSFNGDEFLNLAIKNSMK